MISQKSSDYLISYTFYKYFYVDKPTFYFVAVEVYSHNAKVTDIDTYKFLTNHEFNNAAFADIDKAWEFKKLHPSNLPKVMWMLLKRRRSYLTKRKRVVEFRSRRSKS